MLSNEEKQTLSLFIEKKKDEIEQAKQQIERAKMAKNGTIKQGYKHLAYFTQGNQDVYVLVEQNSTCRPSLDGGAHYYDENGPICHETYLNDASFERARKMKIAREDGKNKKLAIARLVFVDDNGNDIV